MYFIVKHINNFEIQTYSFKTFRQPSYNRIYQGLAHHLLMCKGNNRATILTILFCGDYGIISFCANGYPLQTCILYSNGNIAPKIREIGPIFVGAIISVWLVG